MNLAGCTMERLHDDADLVVYRARSPSLDGAFLVLAPHAHGPVDAFGERFEREQALAARLEPDWAARPLRMTQHEGRTALVLSDPGGAILASTLDGPLGVDRALHLAGALASALREVHGVGLIHGDIRPANVLVGDGDRLWLTGFGCAVSRAGALQPRPAWALASGRNAYLAPEWTADPARVDERADLYSLGVMLYEMLTGNLPFDPARHASNVPRASEAPRPGSRVDGVPDRLDAVVARLLAHDPDDRPASAEALLRDLRACIGERTRESGRDGQAREPVAIAGPDRPDPARLLAAVRLLSRQATPEEVGASLVRLCIDLAGARRATLVLFDAEETRVAASAIARQDAIEVEAGAPVPAIAETARGLVADPAWTARPLTSRAHPTEVAVPLSDGGPVTGVLCLAFGCDARALDPGLMEDLDAVAAQGAVSLAMARHHRAALRREALLSAGEALSHVGSWSLDLPSGRLTWSVEHYRILGLEPDPRSSPQVDSFLDKVHPDDRRRCQDSFAAALRQRAVFEVDFRIVSHDGRIKHVHSIGHPVVDAAGTAREYVGVLMDVTRRRLAEDRLQQAQAELAHVNRIAMLGELVASIAHEVSQPVGAGVTNCEAALRWLQREEPDLVEVENAVRRAVQNGRRAGEVVARLRALVRNSPPELVSLDLNDVVHEALPIIQQELSRRDVTLELGLARAALPVAGDRVQLQQVMINLVVNGAQAMEQVRDRRRIVKLTTRPGERDDVRLVVRDTGPGIDARMRERLFSAFFTTKPNGMGIGLSICRSIIETHGGTISAGSADDGGAIFEVRLPRIPDSAP